jgi:uncharacterized membrane protein YhaH (DUF805 family)
MNVFWNNYVSVLKKYTMFDGRAGRAEFWQFVVVNFIVGMLISFVSHGLSNLYSLLVIIPSLAVGARRLHDTSRSGWWQLIALVPVIGWIVLIIFFAQRGKHS